MILRGSCWKDLHLSWGFYSMIQNVVQLSVLHGDLIYQRVKMGKSKFPVMFHLGKSISSKLSLLSSFLLVNVVSTFHSSLRKFAFCLSSQCLI